MVIIDYMDSGLDCLEAMKPNMFLVLKKSILSREIHSFLVYSVFLHSRPKMSLLSYFSTPRSLYYDICREFDYMD